MVNKKILSLAVTALMLLSIVAIAAPTFAISTGATHISVPTATSANANTSPNIPAYSTAFTSPASPGTAVSIVTVGQKVVLSGTDAGAFDTIKIYWDSVSDAALLGTTSAGAPPNQATPQSWNITVTIPQAAHGTHNFIINDGATNIGMGVTVASKLSASVTPSTGSTVSALVGDTVTLTGTGFASQSGITLTFNGNPIQPTATTDINGTFTASIAIPVGTSLGSSYAVVATDSATPANTGTAYVYVGYYIAVSPSGSTAPVPPGVTVTISGRITASTAYTLSIDSVAIQTGTSDSNGRFSQTYSLPSLLASGTHTVSIVAGALVITPVNLITGGSPTATLTAYTGVAGTLITVTGAGFDASANVTLRFGATVVNSTATDSRFGPTTSAGALTAVFSVPSLPAGVYVVTVTDQYGATATTATSFTVNAAALTTVSTASSFAQGDIISFNITTTDPAVIAAGVNVAIKDPTGVYQWGVIDANGIPAAGALGSVHWTVVPTTVGGTAAGNVPVSAQIGAVGNQFLILPNNAPIGSWNWTIQYSPTSGGIGLVTGLFTVTAGGVSGITTQINDLGTKIDNIASTLQSIQGDIATIKTSTGTITTSVSSLSGQLTSISNAIATITSPDLGPITASLSSISAKLDSVSGDTATVSTSVGSITTSLSSLNTAVTGLQGDVSSLKGSVATVQTDLGTLSGTVTSITGNVATIQTSIGTLQADISGLQTSDTGVASDDSNAKNSTDSLSPMIIVAIVLALIAAIAAIASIVLMRRKIAG
jgi:prefoldin subunit 5